MDVFVDRKKRVWIVDFNPFGDPSSSLLFEWSELQSLCSNLKTLEHNENSQFIDNKIKSEVEISNINPIIETESEIDFEFRIINNQRETFPNPSGASRGPIDVTFAPDFHKFMEICKHQDKDHHLEKDELH